MQPMGRQCTKCKKNRVPIPDEYQPRINRHMSVGNGAWDKVYKKFSLGPWTTQYTDDMNEVLPHIQAMAGIINTNFNLTDTGPWTNIRYENVVAPLVAYMIEKLQDVKLVHKILNFLGLRSTNLEPPFAPDEIRKLLGTFRDYTNDKFTAVTYFIFEAVRNDNPELYDVAFGPVVVPTMKALGMTYSAAALDANKFWILPEEQIEKLTPTVLYQTHMLADRNAPVSDKFKEYSNKYSTRAKTLWDKYQYGMKDQLRLPPNVNSEAYVNALDRLMKSNVK